ncbi:hypothetical protein SLEP1_g15159 [Rubroshorea leprosula]|uniref:Integrase catalytic domain-containing protein n=1 Tax=Rubroshorea leprosula TaxID=152421 RepID=A0AAV5ISD1_9ROSI|nr:hypothetical protein SLEP1_g15159 [Rubroshorea leprosula]
MAQMERSVHAMEQAVTLLIENHGQLRLPPIHAHRARVPPRRYSPSQMFGNQWCTPRSQDLLFPLEQREVPHWNFRPHRLANVPHNWTRGSTSVNTLESASRVQAQHHFRGDEPTQASLEDKIVITNCKVQLSRMQDSLKERNETLQKDMETLCQQIAELHMTQQQVTDAPQIASIVAKEREHLNWPEKLRSNGNKRDKTHHCAFHGTHGHGTEDCKQLRMEIEQLIRRGALRQFIEHLESQRGARRMERLQDNREASRHKEKEPLDVVGVFPHDPLMIKIVVEDRNLRKGKVMKCVLVDTRSCRDVMCYGAFKKLGVSPQLMRPCDFSLVGFSRKSVLVICIISLPIHVGVTPCVAIVTLYFFVIDVPSFFNAILGRPGLNSLQAVVSTQAMMIKFPTPNGVGMARGKLIEVVERTPQAQDQVQTLEPNQVTKKKYKSKHWDLVAFGDIVKEKTLTVDSLDMREELKECQTEPIDQVKPVVLDEKRPKRIVNIGVNMDQSFIARLKNCLREHKDIFAWCPADMPSIDPKITCHRLGVNSDAVPVKQKVRHFEAKKTATIEEEVAKLKEAGFIQEITFSKWLSNVVMVKKANGKWRMCVDFTDLNNVCPKDNYPLPNIDELVDNSFGYVVLSLCDAYSGHNQIPITKEDKDKTAFITVGGIYCYVVMPFCLKNARATCQRGIEVNPKKIHAVLGMKPPSSIKEVQKLMGRVVALSKFISKFTEWTILGEKLYLYIAMSIEAISVALVREDGNKQEPVHYVGKVLQGAETRYKPLEKLAYAAGFIAELSKEEKAVMQAPPIDVPSKRKAPESKKPTKNLPSNLVWNLYVDGSSNAVGSGAGIILISPEGETFECALKFNSEASNSRAKHKALLEGLRLAKAARVEYLRIYSDSQLIVNQGYELSQVRRSENLKANAMAKLASIGLGVSRVEVYIGTLSSPSMEMENALPTQEEQSWVDPILTFLKSGILPEDEKEAKGLHKEAAWYTIFDGQLYRRFYTHLLLKCLGPIEAQILLEEHQPANPLHMIVASWPFGQWGMNNLGPFPKAKGRKTFLIVAIDYFTKWIEVGPVAQIIEQKEEEFIKKHIMCRFRMPRVLVTDNGTQFASEAFKDFCQTEKVERRFSVRAQLETEGLSLQQIKQRFASVAYLESNGQAEIADELNLYTY